MLWPINSKTMAIKIMIKISIFCLFSYLIIGASCKPDFNSDISQLVNGYIVGDKFSGIIRVYKDNNIIFSKSAGFADFKARRPLNDNTPFRIGSVSKTFTAISILILYERNKLSLTDTIGRFITYLPKSYQGVTLKQLLTHTSGIPDYLVRNPLVTDSLINSDAIDSLISKDFLYFQPGTKFRYCNSGYMILGLIVEKVTNMSFQEFVKQNIFQPLDMDDTYFLEPNNFKQADRALSHDNFGNIWEIPLFVKGDGGMVSTTDDLYKWYKGLTSNRIISDSTFEKAIQSNITTKGDTTNYGYGFETFPTKHGLNIAGHRGGLGGTGVYFVFEPSGDNFIITMTNNNCQKTGEIVERISMLLNDFDYNKND